MPTDFAAARLNMVNNQILANKVNDPLVVAALSEVSREAFLPKSLHGMAYADEDIALGNDRYLIEPMILARLLQIAAIQPDDVVLDIGCAVGYSSAVLSKLASTVVALESDAELVGLANKNLAELGCDNAAVVEGALKDGSVKQGPFDVIVIAGALRAAPSELLDQLNDGGRLVTVIDNQGIGKATLFERHGDVTSKREYFDAQTPFLPGFDEQSGFVF